MENPTVCLSVNEEVVGWAVIDGGYLEQIGIHEDHRRKGLGTSLLLMVFDYMKKTKTRMLRFTNAHFDFWDAMKTKFPNNIKLAQKECVIIVS